MRSRWISDWLRVPKRGNSARRKSHLLGRPGRLWRALTLCLALLATGSHGAPVQAEAPLPKLPEGYTLKPHGEVRWIYPTSGESEVARLEAAYEEQWRRVTAQLGYAGDDAMDIRIGINPEQMQALAPPGLRLPSYASGVALPEHGVIFLTFTAPDTWLRPDMERVLAHELSHVALYRATGGNPVPRWFSEGLAVQQSGEHSLQRIRTLWEGSLRNDLIPLGRLASSFPAKHGEVSLAYAQSADIVGHLLAEPAATQRLAAVLAAVRAGEPFDAAIAEGYGITLTQLEREWRTELRNRYGRWPSLLMGLTAVWAFGALLLVLGYIRARRRHHQTVARWAEDEAALLHAASMARAPIHPAPRPVPAADTSAKPPSGAALERASRDAPGDSGVPKIVHEGQSHTLH